MKIYAKEYDDNTAITYSLYKQHIAIVSEQNRSMYIYIYVDLFSLTLLSTMSICLINQAIELN